jgi:TolB protein
MTVDIHEWRQGFVGMALMAVLLTPHPATSAAPSVSSPRTWGARIAFARYTSQSARTQIYAVRSTGGPVARVPLQLAVVTGPSWSPDGKWLAFLGGANSPDTSDVTSNGTIYVAQPDGSHMERLYHGPGRVSGLSWSPDSTRLVFARAATRGSGSSLWIVDTPSKRARKVTSGWTDVQPSWSPDGRTIVFLRIDTKTYQSRIQLVRPNGSGLRQILVGWSHILEPVWSPDGSWLLVHDAAALYRVRPDGSGRQILATLSADTRGAREDPQPTWSPDGSRVVFCQYRPKSIGLSDLWVVGSSGTGARQLTRSPGSDTAPTWGP